MFGIIKKDYLGVNIVVVTKSGNKLEGEVLNSESDDILKLKTSDGIIMINTQAIESIY